MIRILILTMALLLAGGCAYVGTMARETGYSMRQILRPEQRVTKHMLGEDTFFVFGRVLAPLRESQPPMAVLAISDLHRVSEVVDINHLAHSGVHYGLNLPAGDYRLLLVADLNDDGEYTPGETLSAQAMSLTDEEHPGRVVGDIDIGPQASAVAAEASQLAGLDFRQPVREMPALQTSLFYPRGSIRALDDPLFDPDMATLGLYAPGSFLEAAPMMFHALEEDLPHKIPVVLVHGIGGSPRDFAAIVASLDRSRFRPWFFYYPSGLDLDQLAEMFHRVFLSGEVMKLGETPMVIVAHSMGGLVVREALNRQRGAPEEAQVARLITLATPFGGHPGAARARSAPVVIPSWRDLDPDSRFIARLTRRPLPLGLEHHLIHATLPDEQAADVRNAGDGVVPLSSQLHAAVTAAQPRLHPVSGTHTGILQQADVLDRINRIAGEAESPLPKAQLALLRQGGFDSALGPGFTSMEAYFIRRVGRFMQALATGAYPPTDDRQRHFVAVAQGREAPDSPIEHAWLKFVGDHPAAAAQ